MSEFVLRQHETAAVVETPRGLVYSLDRAAELAGVDTDLIRSYCELGLLAQVHSEGPDAEARLAEDALYEVRRIEHFRRGHGVNLQALPLLCALVHEVERLRREVRHLRDA